MEVKVLNLWCPLFQSFKKDVIFVTHALKTNKEKLCLHLGCELRDLSEISWGGGGVETEGGSQLFETQKREGS